MTPIRFAIVRPNGRAPRRATEGAAGYDLCSAQYLTTTADEPPLVRVRVHLGISIEIPRGYVGRIVARSSCASRFNLQGIEGTIDSDYRGPLYFQAVALGDVNIAPGDRLCQLLVQPLAPVGGMHQVPEAELSVTARGAGGFGSTGVR